jgi:hypothetical protein
MRRNLSLVSSKSGSVTCEEAKIGGVYRGRIDRRIIMRLYVASAVFFVLGCLFIGGAVWARLQIGREIFYRTSEFGLVQFKSYRYVVIFQLKQAAIEILSKLGIWIGLFCFFCSYTNGLVMAGR